MLRSTRTYAVAALITACMSGVADAKTLKAVHYVSPKHPVGVAYQALADEVKRDSKGALTIRVFAGESLLPAKAISDGLRDQVADIGEMIYTYTPAYYPHGILINDLALVGTNDLAALMAYTELYLLHCPVCLNEVGKQKQLPLVNIATPPYMIIANGDFNSSEKMHLKKLRAGGSLWDRFAKAIGAVGVNMPTSGMYEAISRGTLDGAIYAIGGLKTHGLGDVAKQVILLNAGSFRSGLLFSMSKPSWAGLTVEERKVLLRAFPKAAVRSAIAYANGEDEGREVAKQKNIPIVEPDAGLAKMRAEFVESDLKLTIKNAKETLKIDDAEEFVANYRKLYDKYDKLIQPIASDEPKLAAMMYNEIYAKIDPATFGLK